MSFAKLGKRVLHKAKAVLCCIQWYCIVLHGILLQFRVLHYIVRYYKALQGTIWYLHRIVWYCILLMMVYCVIFHVILKLYCVVLSGISQYVIVLHSIVSYCTGCTVLHGIEGYFIVLHLVASYQMVLPSIVTQYCRVIDGIVLWCMVLHAIVCGIL